jgi:hypothetical protein
VCAATPLRVDCRLMQHVMLMTALVITRKARPKKDAL